VSPRRLKAALRCGDALDREGFDWLGEALDRSPAEVAQPEQVADEAAGGAGENDLSGFGESLQARREIGGLARDGPLPRRALTEQVADDDKPGGNADADGEPLRSTGLQARHRRFYFEPRPHRPLGIVLMGPRIAEIDQHPVAHEFSDKAVIARDDAGNGVLIGADLFTQFLGVEPHRQGRRTDEITEHHRQLPPLGSSANIGGCDGCKGRFGCRLCVLERCNGIEQPAAVPDRRDPEIAQILGRQPAQNLTINIVVTERRRVLFEPETAKPFGDVHRCCPDTASLGDHYNPGAEFCPRCLRYPAGGRRRCFQTHGKALTSPKSTIAPRLGLVSDRNGASPGAASD